MSVKAICFDFDGTLAHFTSDFEGFIGHFCGEFMLTQREMEGFTGALSSALGREGQVTLQSAVLGVLNGLQVRPPGDLRELIARFLNDCSSQMALLPGAEEVLAFCAARKMPLALLTNGPEDMQRASVRAVGIEGYFKRVLISGDPDVAVRKPNPRIFELACAALLTRPEETLMVGDNVEADVRGALGYGMQAVHIGAEVGSDYETLPDVRAFGAWLQARF